MKKLVKESLNEEITLTKYEIKNALKHPLYQDKDYETYDVGNNTILVHYIDDNIWEYHYDPKENNLQVPDKKHVIEIDINKILNEHTSFNDTYKISGSGLFVYNCNLTNKEKIEIIEWYNSLSPKEKWYVDKLRNEAKQEAENDAAEEAAGEDI